MSPGLSGGADAGAEGDTHAGADVWADGAVRDSARDRGAANRRSAPATGLSSLGALTPGLRVRLPRLSPGDRDQMLQDLSPEGDALPRYLRRFGSLMVLSAAIAGFGLLNNSSAVVIGAMLVAPLMTPILAAAASVCTADGRRLGRALLVQLGGAALAILVGVLVSLLSGNSVVAADDLPEEVLARTEPGLLDLAIAVSAGAAAGYVAPRRETLSALPGVGIAVALVPPLAVVGICLAVGARAEAGGALLLYLTNLAAIIFAGALVLLASGLTPPGASFRRRVRIGMVVTLGAVVAVALPLTLHTIEVVRDTTFRRTVVASIKEWDEDADVVALEAEVRGGIGDVEVRIAGEQEPRPAWELAEMIADRHGGPVDLRLSVAQTTDVEVSAR